MTGVRSAATRPAAVPVLHRRPSALAVLILAACGGGDGSTTTEVPVDGPARVEVLPPQLTLEAGAESLLVARVLDRLGREIASAPVSWEVGHPQVVALVGPGGRIRGVDTGRGTVTARTPRLDGGWVEGTAEVEVLAHPGLTASNPEVSLTTQAGDGGHEPVVIEIEAAAGQVADLAVEVRFEEEGQGPWLVASLRTTATPTTLTLIPRLDGLAEGEHRAAVTVASRAPAVPPLIIPVRVVVAPRAPRLRVEPPSADIRAVVGESEPHPVELALSADSGAELRNLSVSVVPAAESGGWLIATLDRTHTPTVLRLRATLGHLPTGKHTAHVVIQAPAATNTPLTVPVTLTLVDRPAVIEVTPGDLEFFGTEGDGAIREAAVEIRNGGGGALHGLEAEVLHPEGGPVSWLEVALSGPTAPATLTVRASTGGLPPGSHSARIRLKAPGAANAPVEVPVTLHLTPRPPEVVLNPAAIALGPVGSGLPLPDPVVVEVRNGGGGSLGGLQVEVLLEDDSPGGWLSASLTGSASPAEVIVQLLAAAAGLEPGTHAARIRVTSPDAPGGGAEVRVSVEVVQTHVLTVHRRSGSGSVASTPAGILLPAGNLSDSSRVTFPEGIEISLAVLDSIGWVQHSLTTADGVCAGGPTCTLTLNADTRVDVRSTYFDYGVFAFISGGGRTRHQSSFDLPEGGRWIPFGGGWMLGDYRFHPVNRIIVSEALPDPGWRFAGWEGSCTHMEFVCEARVVHLVPGATNNLVARFEPDPGEGQSVEEAWPHFNGPVSFSFSTEGGGTPPPQEVLFNEGGSRSINPVAVVFTPGPHPSWLTMTVEEEGNAARLRVSVNPQGLTAGTYQHSRTYASHRARDVTVTVQVTLTVVP